MQGQTPGYVLTTMLTPPLSATLTSLAAVRDELGITNANDTANDTWLTKRAIPQCSSDIARFCNRVLGLATYQDEFRPQRGVWGEGVRSANNPLLLTRWPVVANVQSFTGNTHSSMLVDGIAFAQSQQLANGMLVSGAGIPSGTTIAQVFASSIQLSQPATATATGVTFSTGLSVVETVAGTVTGLACGTDYEIETASLQAGDEGSGRLYRLNASTGSPKSWAHSKITVVYQAGYVLPNDTGNVTLPADIEEACLKLVTARFRSRGRDPMLVEQSQSAQLGMQRWWVGGSPGQKGAMPPDIEALLTPYRVPVIA